MKRKKAKAQTFLEYAVLIAIFAAAIVAMKIYFTRALQEKYRESADVFGRGEQYAKGITVESEVNSANVNSPTDPPGPGPSGDPCPSATASVDALKSQIDSLTSQAADLEKAAGDINGIIPNLKAQHATLIASAEAKEKEAANKRAQAQSMRDTAASKEAEAANDRSSYPDCFGSGLGEGGSSGYTDPVTGEYHDCSGLINTVSQLESDAANLRSQASVLDSDAGVLEKDAADIRVQANALWQAILDLESRPELTASEAQAAELNAQAAKLRSDAAMKQAEIDNYKSKYHACF